MAYDKAYISELEGELKVLAQGQNLRYSDYRAERIKHLRQRVSVPVVFIEAGEVAVGDYSPDYGTVKAVEKKRDDIYIEFVNGKQLTMPEDAEIEMDQGGRFDRYRQRVVTEEVKGDGSNENPQPSQ
jgi:hypothetical protein